MHEAWREPPAGELDAPARPRTAPAREARARPGPWQGPDESRPICGIMATIARRAAVGKAWERPCCSCAAAARMPLRRGACARSSREALSGGGRKHFAASLTAPLCGFGL